jgi:DNA-binding LacI/PurR family transcriptional regulator
MAITIRQLADHLNASPSTVSRALSFESGVGSEKAKEIRQIAARLGYRSKPLRKRNNKTIGLIISSEFTEEPEDAYQMALMANAMSRVGAEGWFFHSEITVRGSQSSKLVEENRVDAVMLSGYPSPELCATIRSSGLPAVVLDDLYERTGIPSILSDVSNATAELLRWLYDMGHRRMAMIVNPEHYPSVAKRIDSFTSTLSDLPPEDRQVVRVRYSTVQQGQVATRQLMMGAKAPTALVYGTDRLAIGGMIELARLGIKIPQDVGIVSYNNTPLSREVDPALTSVDMNVKKKIEAAFNILRQLCDKKDEGDEINQLPKQVIIEPEVIWRNSCGPVLQGV